MTIAHLRDREKELEPLGWTGAEAEWIALVCLHSGIFTRPQFGYYFDTDSKSAHRFVQALVERARRRRPRCRLRRYERRLHRLLSDLQAEAGDPEPEDETRLMVLAYFQVSSDGAS